MVWDHTAKPLQINLIEQELTVLLRIVIAVENFTTDNKGLKNWNKRRSTIIQLIDREKVLKFESVQRVKQAQRFSWWSVFTTLAFFSQLAARNKSWTERDYVLNCFY